MPDRVRGLNASFYSIRAEVEGIFAGYGLPRLRINPDTGECLAAGFLINVKIPCDPMTDLAYNPAIVNLYLEPGHLFYRTYEVTDCTDIIEISGTPPESFRLSWCITGCPGFVGPGAA